MKESPRGDVPSRGTLSLPTEPSVPSDGTTLGVEKGHGLDAGWQSRRYHRVGRGIGASCAKLFAREGCQVVVNDYGLDTNGRLRGRTRRTRWWRRSRRQAATLWRNSGQANYGAAMGAFAAITRVIARDLGRYGVTANAIPARKQAGARDRIGSGASGSRGERHPGRWAGQGSR